MDISAFSDDNFEVKEWINQTFRTAEAQENKDAFVSSTVMKLQLYVQQVNSALEETSQQVLQGLPRVMRDAKMIHQEALMLREKMQSIRHEIVQVEKATGTSMASLESIDRIKTDLQTAKEALHEADNWTLLATDIEEVFESKSVDKIASKLMSMQQSLHILANAATDYEDRKLQLEGLKNRLEAIASPQLVQAFTAGNIEESRRFVSIFAGMERVSQLIKYYDRCQKGALCQQWRSLVEVEQDQTVVEWINTYYDILLSNWHKQVKWCTSVFGDASSLVEVYGDVLVSLDPPVHDCIETALKQQVQSHQLPFLAQLKHISKNFANSLQMAMAAHMKSAAAWSGVASAIFAPYVPYMSRYAGLEEAHMGEQVRAQAAQLAARDDMMDAVQGLGQSIATAMSTAGDAIKRCLSFTDGCALPGLIKAFKDGLFTYFDWSTFGRESIFKSNNNRLLSESTPPKVYFSSYLDLYTSVLRQLEKNRADHETWHVFQMCLTLLQTTGELLIELKRLDQDLVQTILDFSRKESLQTFASVLLVPAAQQELRQLVSAIQDGVTTSCLESVTLSVEKFCREVHYTTYKVIFSPVSMLLDTAAHSWSSVGHASSGASSAPSNYSHTLPDYSFAPQEYITEIGEYLMTLPQHLEPFLVTSDNTSLTGALQLGGAGPAGGGGEGAEPTPSGGGFADLLLGMVARGACQTYLDHILAISQLTPSASKQLAIDIKYLGNVLEDLGFGLLDSLQHVSVLLKVPAEEYQSQTTGAPPKLVAAVRQMRNIPST